MQTEDPASFSLLSIVNEADMTDVFSIRIPGLLSFLAYNAFQGEVKGIHQLQVTYQDLYGPGNYVPPIAVSYWTFRLMVGAGFLMALLALVGLYLVFRERFEQQRLYLTLLMPAIALPYIANTTGWLLTEVGRQPWIVFGLQKTEDAVSPAVSAGTVLFSLATFTVLYGALMVADIYLLSKYAKSGPEGQEDLSPAGAH